MSPAAQPSRMRAALARGVIPADRYTYRARRRPVDRRQFRRRRDPAPAATAPLGLVDRAAMRRDAAEAVGEYDVQGVRSVEPEGRAAVGRQCAEAGHRARIQPGNRRSSSPIAQAAASTRAPARRCMSACSRRATRGRRRADQRRPRRGAQPVRSHRRHDPRPYRRGVRPTGGPPGHRPRHGGSCLMLRARWRSRDSRRPCAKPLPPTVWPPQARHAAAALRHGSRRLFLAGSLAVGLAISVAVLAVAGIVAVDAGRANSSARSTPTACAPCWCRRRR